MENTYAKITFSSLLWQNYWHLQQTALKKYNIDGQRNPNLAALIVGYMT